MYAYAMRGPAWIQPGDVSTLRPAHRFMVGDSLSELEQQCGWQAEAGVSSLLKQHDGIPQTRVSRSGRLRRRIVAALIRVGACRMGVQGSGLASESVPAVDPFGTAR
jgi:hypothetical protein